MQIDIVIMCWLFIMHSNLNNVLVPVHNAWLTVFEVCTDKVNIGKNFKLVYSVKPLVVTTVRNVHNNII